MPVVEEALQLLKLHYWNIKHTPINGHFVICFALREFFPLQYAPVNLTIYFCKSALGFSLSLQKHPYKTLLTIDKWGPKPTNAFIMCTYKGHKKQEITFNQDANINSLTELTIIIWGYRMQRTFQVLDNTPQAVAMGSNQHPLALLDLRDDLFIPEWKSTSNSVLQALTRR